MISSEVPELDRKLREACRKYVRHITSKSEFLVPSYDQQTKSILFVFPNFLTLELENKNFGLQLRILRDDCPLQPAPQGWNPKSREYLTICCVIVLNYRCFVVFFVCCEGSSYETTDFP